MNWLLFLDIVLLFLHTGIVLFSLVGWMFSKTRKLHGYAICVILAGWLIIGAIKGHVGYCFLTDIHWDIKRELGQRNSPSSFTQYLIQEILQTKITRKLADIITILGVVIPVLGSLTIFLLKRTFNIHSK